MDDRESMMISRTESLLGRALNEEEKYDIEQWDRGRTLSQIVHTDSWAILLNAIKSYVDKAVNELINMAPGDKNVPTAHAAASALTDFYIRFQQDVNSAIAASLQTPPVLMEAARVMSDVPPESI